MGTFKRMALLGGLVLPDEDPDHFQLVEEDRIANVPDTFPEVELFLITQDHNHHVGVRHTHSGHPCPATVDNDAVGEDGWQVGGQMFDTEEEADRGFAEVFAQIRENGNNIVLAAFGKPPEPKRDMLAMLMEALKEGNAEVEVMEVTPDGVKKAELGQLAELLAKQVPTDEPPAPEHIGMYL